MKTVFSSALLLLLLTLLSTFALAAGPFLTTPQGARYQDLKDGTGELAEPGDVVTMHFIGWLDDNGAKGKEIYNTRREGKPVSFVVGTDKVMPGWNEGVTGMRQGGKRLLMLPPALGYGARRVEDIIPPDASLIFLIDLVRLEKR
jgi:FKBP-type peptidyl-prolyl cis-trans isomerase